MGIKNKRIIFYINYNVKEIKVMYFFLIDYYIF